MMIKCGAFIAILLTYINPALAEALAVCTPNAATGFDFNKTSRSWHRTSFDTRGETHSVVRKAGRLVWTTANGPSDVDLPCSEFDQYGFMSCGGALDLVRINRERHRYLSAYTIGYWSNAQDGEDTPMLEIGTCQFP